MCFKDLTVEKIVKEGGFSDLKDFIRVNAKIAWAWNVSQGELGVAKFEDMKNSGEKQLLEAINNPDVPEETKIKLRKSLQEIRDNWKKNKKYADIVLKYVKPLTNQHDLSIIKKYQKELMEAYGGMTINEAIEIDSTMFITGEP